MFLALKSYSTYPTFQTLLAAAFCLVLVACNQEKTATARQSAAVMAKAQANLLAAQKSEAALAALSFIELRKLASTAFREQRLYAPAGNNALEYYLAIRKKSDQPDAMTESALTDLMPYTVIAAEQAMTRLDFYEATRLRDLIASVDADAPALPRISQAIIDGLEGTEAPASAEAKRQQEPLLAAERVMLKPNQELFKPAAAEVATKPVPLPTTAANLAVPVPVTARPTQTQPIAVAASPTRVPNATTLLSKKAELVAIRTPDPGFPSDALNRGLSGAVEIEFVVQRSGEVSEVRVVNSSQRAFDRNVITTVKRWRFGPLDEPMTVRRSFNFNNPS